MLLGFLHKCKLTRHIQRRTPFNLVLVLKFQSTRTTQGMFYLLFIFNVPIYYHNIIFFSRLFSFFHIIFTQNIFYVLNINRISIDISLFLSIQLLILLYQKYSSAHHIFYIVHFLYYSLILPHYIKVLIFFHPIQYNYLSQISV